MLNPFITQKAKITNLNQDSPQVKIFTLKPEKKISFDAGQFIEISLPKIGEAPFAFCSSQYNPETFQVAIQKKGILTNSLFNLKKNEFVHLRGPYGHGFPLEKFKNHDLLLISGGIGLAPIRSVIRSIIDRRKDYKKVTIFYGTKCEESRIFENEFPIWEKQNIHIKVTLNQCQPKWQGDQGVITTLFEKAGKITPGVAIAVGPPIMYQSVIAKLKELKFKDENIYLSLERRMHCGIGICQHCALANGKYVCKDGPVFSWAEIKNLPNVI